MFRELRAGDIQVLRDALEDTRLTVLIGRGDQFTDMLQSAGDRIDRATFLMSDNSVVDVEQEEAWFGRGGALVVLLDYDGPNRGVVNRFTADDRPADIIDAVLEFEAAQAPEADV